MNPFKLFSPSYLFDPVPGETFMYFWPLAIFLVLVFLASWKVKEMIKNMRNPKLSWELLGGIPGRMREFALLGLLLTFFRNENIPYLGMRFLIVLLFLSALAYGIWTWRHYKKNFSVRIVEKKQKCMTDKYLPKAKKKKKRKKRKR